MNTFENTQTEMPTNLNYSDDIDDLDEPDQYIEQDYQNEIDEDNADENNQILNNRTAEDKIESPRMAAFGEVPKPRMVNLPLSRIKTIMKFDPDTNLITQDALYLITKSTELFIESLARESFQYTSQNKKKTIQKHDVDLAIAATESLMFLDGALNF